MMLTKEKIQKQLDEMPEEFSLDELIDRLILIDKIEAGISDSLAGNTISHEETKKEIDLWFK
jgi:predicted transcriptional regulator